jgi:glycosyltransferase involved in cell wall biosynthesis
LKLLFVADGRSPIALNWMRWWIEKGHEVHLASTFACDAIPGLKGLDLTPVAFSGSKSSSASGNRPASGLWGARTIGLRLKIRQWAGPLTISRSAKRLREVIDRVQPDLLHALRIPYEGMLAADAIAGLENPAPLLVSVWGNDFTLHAPSSPLMRHYTEWTVSIADAIHADCRRDIRLARQWGFPTDHPTFVAPGNGGIRSDVFHPPLEPVSAPVVINPRGFRGYVRSDTFFQSIPKVLASRPDARFLCASMAGEPQALHWIERLGIQASVDLLPALPHRDMADVFRSAAVLVSPSTHDGTPNTLLEGMACGCFPVAGDLESIREWITPGVNGLLVDPSDPDSIAKAILSALDQPGLRMKAAEENRRIISERGEYSQTMSRAEAFYTRLIQNKRETGAPSLQ